MDLNLLLPDCRANWIVGSVSVSSRSAFTPPYGGVNSPLLIQAEILPDYACLPSSGATSSHARLNPRDESAERSNPCSGMLLHASPPATCDLG